MSRNGTSGLGEAAGNRWMAEALALAARAAGRTHPNPPVGALLLRDGRVVGRGFTAPAGGPHAEIRALREAGSAARGASLVVSLEPCCHQGRTPPCTAALIEAGVAEAFVGTIDPNPRVAGRGLAQLREAGLRVTLAEGALAEEARERIAPFARHQRTGRPLVIAKYAMTLDGRIAAHTGHSRWVTGEEARARVHEIRDASDAILVGAGTVRADDPRLTTRLADPARTPHHPLRVILDSRGRLPLSARVFDPAQPGRTLLAARELAPARRRALEARGVETLLLPPDDAGRVSLPALLDALGHRGYTSLLVEGGAEVHGAFFEAGLVQRVLAFVAPKVVGGRAAPGPVGGRGLARMDEAIGLRDVRVEPLGADWLIAGRVALSDGDEDAAPAGEDRTRSAATGAGPAQGSRAAASVPAPFEEVPCSPES